MAYSEILSKSGFIIFLTGLSLFISSCGVTSRVNEPGPSAKSLNHNKGSVIEDGVASWYGPNFHGKLTANGEKYDMYGFTAAHRTLPFNTLVEVVNLENNKTVLVRINDRGPFAKNRIIDLSKRAAEEIAMLGPGTAPVQLYLIEGDLDQSLTTNIKVATYTVQLGSFETEQRALEESRRIEGSRVEKVQLNNKTVYRIYYGVFTDTEEAEEMRKELDQNGFAGYVKQIEN